MDVQLGVSCVMAGATEADSIHKSELWQGTGVRIVRPLLQASKQELEDYCRHLGQQWVTDPSNADEAFQRVAIRSLLRGTQDPPVLSSSELCTDILRVASACASLRSSLQFQAGALIGRAAVAPLPLQLPSFDQGAAGGVIIRASVLTDPGVPREAAHAAMAALLQWVSGSAYPPRSQGVEHLLGLLRASGALRRGFDAGGCAIRPVTGSRGTLFAITPLLSTAG